MILNWILRGTIYDVWKRLLNFNLAMIPFSIIMYYIQDKDAHLYMVGVWSILALIGLFIGKVLLNVNPHSK